VSLVTVSPIAIHRCGTLRTACDNAGKKTSPSPREVASAPAVRYFFLVIGSACAAPFDARRASREPARAPAWIRTESDSSG